MRLLKKKRTTELIFLTRHILCHDNTLNRHKWTRIGAKKETFFLSMKEKKCLLCVFFFLLLKIKSPIALATIQPCNFDHRLVPYKGNQKQKKKKKKHENI